MSLSKVQLIVLRLKITRLKSISQCGAFLVGISSVLLVSTMWAWWSSESKWTLINYPIKSGLDPSDLSWHGVLIVFQCAPFGRSGWVSVCL